MIKLSSTTRGLASLYATTLTLSFGHGMYIPAIPAMAAAFEVSIGAAAQIVTAHAAGRLVGSAAGGMIVDRLGARIVLVVGPLFIVAAALAIAATPYFLPILAAMFVAGVGDSAWMMAREVAALDYVRLDQRGRLISSLMGFNSVGMALGPLLGGGLTELFDYRAVFVAYAAIALVTTLASLSAKVSPHAPVPASAGPIEAAAASARSGWGWLGVKAMGIVSLVRQIEPRLRPTYYVLVFATFSMMLYRITLHSMLPLYADFELGLSPTQIGALFTVQGIVVFFWIVPAGLILDKLGRKWATVPSTAVPGIVFLLYPFTDGFVQLLVLAVALGMLGGLSLGALATSTYDVIPPSARGRLQAVRRTIAEGGAVIGPGLGGIIANAYGPGVVFLVYGPVILIAALLLGVVARETLVKAPKPAA